METVLQTERLMLRQFDESHAEFILELVNDPDWIRFIGDKNVKDLDDARRYIEEGPAALQARYGFSLYRVELKAGGTPIGMCGLIKRDGLEYVDVGFAFLPHYRGRGYAQEALTAVVEHARSDIGLKRLVAITNPDNHASIKVLERAGLKFEKAVYLPAKPEEQLSLYALTLQ